MLSLLVLVKRYNAEMKRIGVTIIAVLWPVLFAYLAGFDFDIRGEAAAWLLISSTVFGVLALYLTKVTCLTCRKMRRKKATHIFI